MTREDERAKEMKEKGVIEHPVALCELCDSDKEMTKCMEHDRFFCLNCHKRTVEVKYGVIFAVQCVKASCNFTRLNFQGC